MIIENTVLILGAGASKPYGYPTAFELREEIIIKLIPKLKAFALEGNPNADLENNLYVKRLHNMIDKFKKSSTESIDLFLTRNRGYYDYGKQIITFLLGSYELTSKFREDLQNRQYDWYFNLYNILSREILKVEDLVNFSKNKVSIITFNYDRSLEHFLFESLSNSFTDMDLEVAKIMQEIKIIHVYGKLAPLDWEGQGGVKYGQTYIRDKYEEYSKNIQILFDERDSQTEEITQLIKEAKKILFLGFGFADENIKALGLDQSILNRQQNIFGTALGLTDREVNKNIQLMRINNQNMSVDKFRFENCDSSLLIRNYL